MSRYGDKIEAVVSACSSATTLRMAACLAAMWMLFGGIAYQTYRVQWANASLFATNVSSLLAQDIARNVEVYDLSISALSVESLDPTILALEPKLRRKTLFDQSADASGLGSLLILDAGGKLLADSRDLAPVGLDLSSRDYFAAQKRNSVQPQPHISFSPSGRGSRHPGIHLSRPRFDADGRFAGVVVGTITPEFFQHLFEAVHLPPGSAISLVHRDGTVMVRASSQDKAGERFADSPVLTQSWLDPSGAFVKTSSLDGMHRLFTYRQVAQLPLFLVVGLATDEFLNVWRWQTAAIGVGFLILSVTIMLLWTTLRRQLKRRALAEQELAKLAATDGLTQLANRRRFDEVLDIEWRRAIRDVTPLGLLMVDGDWFKAYNDTYGHLEGDRALQVMADALQRCIERPGDLVARYGGEEFVILLPATDPAGALNIAHAVRAAVLTEAIEHLGSRFGILTVSVGVASWQPQFNEDPSILLEAADTALYAAKADGRNRVEFGNIEDAVRSRRGGQMLMPRIA